MSAEQKEGKKPLLIFCHGLGGTKDSGIIDQLYQRTPHKALRFDFAGFGDAPGEFIGIQDQVKQLTHVISEQQEPAVLIGHSLGGTTALLTHHPLILAKVIIAAPTQPDALRENTYIFPGAVHTDSSSREYTITELFVAEAKTLRLPPQNTPILSLYGTQDTTVPPRHAPTEPLFVEDDHDFEHTAEELSTHITHFVEEI